MTRRPLGSALLFVVVLAALSAAVLAIQQKLYAEPPVRDLTPTVVAPPQGRAPATQPAATASGVPVVDPAWLRRTSSRSGVSPVALAAYARAELMSPAGCGLGWTTLAGIGWIESQHATIGGRSLGADGRASSRILGPALDGTGNVKAIPATAESTAWHGDPDWDHAVGPMQFIPTTWDLWAADGDGDGVADPNDLDDAALAAARYLCADGRSLSTGSGWAEGVFSYNQAQVYVDDVHATATEYAERVG